MKKIRLFGILWALCFLLLPAVPAYGEGEGTWSLSDDGKYWMYFLSPGEPLKDAWIEEDGKEYYLDSGGRMKTGWVTDSRDGNRYYMGDDGAKAFHAFTPDGHYVGEDGLVLEAFDTYRKALKQPLNKIMKSKEYRGLEVDRLPVFSLVDLNGDGYRDLVIFNSMNEPHQLLLAAIWEPEEEKLLVSAEGDGNGEGASSRITYNPDTQKVWLTMKDGKVRDRDYFAVDSNSTQFEHIWQFTIDKDDWGDPIFYCNGEQLTGEEWNQALEAADREAGGALQSLYLPLTEESIKEGVDCAPSQEEMPLWQP